MNLVVVPFHDWKKSEREGFRTRDVHLIQELARHPSVEKLLIVDRPSSWAEVALLRRPWHVRKGTAIHRTHSTQLTQVGPRAFVLDMLLPEIVRPVVMRRRWIPYAFALPAVSSAIEEAQQQLDIGPTYALLLFEPLFAPLLQHLKPSVLAIDAVDNLLKHALYRDMPGLADMYALCQEHAQVITTNSPENAAWLGQGRDDVHCIPNGVDTTFFDPNERRPVPHDIQDIPRPIVGYAGKMQEMVDVDLAIATAQALPDVSFVFIGQQLDEKWMRPLWRLDNVYYLGDKLYESLPSYLSCFDVCSIPYSPIRQHGVDPIKFYEYLAMQKLVVTTNIGAVSRFAEVPRVCVARTRDEYVAGVSAFVELVRRGEALPPFALPEECTWRSKADRILGLIDNKMPTDGRYEHA